MYQYIKDTLSQLILHVSIRVRYVERFVYSEDLYTLQVLLTDYELCSCLF